MRRTIPPSVQAAEAIRQIKNGSRVFIGSACGEPRHLIECLVDTTRIQDVMIFQMMAISLEQYLEDISFTNRFAVKLFSLTNPMQKASLIGKVDYIPAYLSEIPTLFTSHQIGLDVALVQISPPDAFGYASLGVSVDITREAVRCADLVIAQVNSRMPRTHGDGFIHIGDIDYLVPFDEALTELVPAHPDQEVTRRIARYVADLVDDGSTLQVGYGVLPYSMLQYLGEKNDLGVHTHMITDAFLPLLINGNITNKWKTYFKDRTLASSCTGSREVYDYIDNNPTFYFGTADLINNPAVIALNDRFISISSAMEVDLTGQVCSESVERNPFTGSGDQSNFIRGATLSKGGFSIIALPSTNPDGTRSRIVSSLCEGAGLATLRADVNFVVTEYGIAQLHGKSIFQRVVELAQIAHPGFRRQLIEQAKKDRFIVADQLPPRSEDLLFLEDYKDRVCLPNRKLMTIRPLLPSDEIAYRNFFYSLDPKTIYLRFFYNVNVFSHQMAQAHWSHLDYRKNITLIGLVRHQANKEIIAVGTYAGLLDGEAEVAFVVRDDFQGLGIAGLLLEKLETIARENAGHRFVATMLKENEVMQHIFRKRYPDAEIQDAGEEIRMVMPFADGQQPVRG
jgi:acyl-CoA hydrolase/GNAT superfamily N-acetyltransferase